MVWVEEVRSSDAFDAWFAAAVQMAQSVEGGHGGDSNGGQIICEYVWKRGQGVTVPVRGVRLGCTHHPMGRVFGGGRGVDVTRMASLKRNC